MSFRARPVSNPTYQVTGFVVLTQRVNSVERHWNSKEEKGLTDSISWRVKTLADMVGGGERDASRRCPNTLNTPDKIRGDDRHVIE